MGRKKSKVKTHCSFCGKEIEVFKYKTLYNKNVFCNRKCYQQWAINNNPFKGKHHTSESIEKNRQAHLGKTHETSEETKKKISESLKGHIVSEETKRKLEQYKRDKASNWKGGITNEKQLIRSSRLVRKWRKKVLERDNYQCVCCGSKENLNVHHINSFSVDEKHNSLDNGITLCFRCHTYFHYEYGTKNNNIYQLIEFINN